MKPLERKERIIYLTESNKDQTKKTSIFINNQTKIKTVSIQEGFKQISSTKNKTINVSYEKRRSVCFGLKQNKQGEKNCSKGTNVIEKEGLNEDKEICAFRYKNGQSQTREYEMEDFDFNSVEKKRNRLSFSDESSDNKEEGFKRIKRRTDLTDKDKAVSSAVVVNYTINEYKNSKETKFDVNDNFPFLSKRNKEAFELFHKGNSISLDSNLNDHFLFNPLVIRPNCKRGFQIGFSIKTGHEKSWILQNDFKEDNFSFGNLFLFLESYYFKEEYRKDLLYRFTDKEVLVFYKQIKQRKGGVEDLTYIKNNLFSLAEEFFFSEMKRSCRFSQTSNKAFIFNTINKILTKKLLKRKERKISNKVDQQDFFFDHYFKNDAHFKKLTDKDKKNLRDLISRYREADIVKTFGFRKFVGDFSKIFHNLTEELKQEIYIEKFESLFRFIEGYKEKSLEEVAKNRTYKTRIPHSYKILEGMKNDFENVFGYFL